jgi:hypothetical protein
MKEHSELEIKMLNQIGFLIGMINVYEKAFQLIYGRMSSTADWVNKNWDLLNKKDNFVTILNDLNKEFDWNFEMGEPLNDKDTP